MRTKVMVECTRVEWSQSLNDFDGPDLGYYPYVDSHDLY